MSALELDGTKTFLASCRCDLPQAPRSVRCTLGTFAYIGALGEGSSPKIRQETILEAESTLGTQGNIAIGDLNEAQRCQVMSRHSELCALARYKARLRVVRRFRLS
jgi:hypothetical protein